MKKTSTQLGLLSPFGSTPSEVPAEESIVVEGRDERRKMSVTKKQKKKKVSFSLGGLVSGRHHNTADQFDWPEMFLSASPEEVAVASPQDLPVETPQYIGCRISMYETIAYDSKNDDNLCYYSGTFALGGDPDKDFAKSHWMIDSGCTDHLTPFKDDFAHLGTAVRSASVANRQTVPMYGPGKIILESFKGSEPIVLEEVWYVPHAAHRLLSVNTLTGQGYRCVINDQESRRGCLLNHYHYHRPVGKPPTSPTHPRNTNVWPTSPAPSASLTLAGFSIPCQRAALSSDTPPHRYQSS